MIRALHEKSERYFRFQIVNAPIRQQAHDEHMALIALCREGRADDAGAALERHIEQAAAQIRPSSTACWRAAAAPGWSDAQAGVRSA